MQRVHWAIRYGAFALATYTLSLFFAGWREVNTTGHWTGFALLVAGTVLTLGLLTLQGYWIYFEEKNKGSLHKRVALFEKMHTLIESRFAHIKVVRMIQPVVILNKEGNNE